MEHRWHGRDKIQLDVMLYHNAVPIARCATQNLSITGVYLQPAKTDIALNSPVELEISHRDKGITQRFRLMAQVVHISQSGTGLMFKTSNTKTREAITKLVELAEKSHTTL